MSGNFENVGTIPVTTVPVTLSEVMANANPFGSQGRQPTGDLTSVKFTRDGYTYDIDYEYLSRNSQLLKNIYLKDGDVIHLSDSSLNVING